MVDIYNYPTTNQTQTFNGLVEYIVQVSGGLFFPLILLALFIISLVTTMFYGFGRSWVFSSFFCSLFAIFLVVAGLLNPIYMYLLFVMLAGGLMGMRLSKSSNLPQI